MNRIRIRMRFVARALVTIAIGLAVHLGGGGLPHTVRDVLGDALWAAMALWWIGAIAPSLRLAWRAALAVAVCFAIEISQLLHTPALDALRRTRVGHLMLGSGFDSRDFAAYAGGVLAAAVISFFLDARTFPHEAERQPPRPPSLPLRT